MESRNLANLAIRHHIGFLEILDFEDSYADILNG